MPQPGDQNHATTLPPRAPSAQAQQGDRMAIDHDFAAVTCDGDSCDATIPIPPNVANSGFETMVQIGRLVESHGWFIDLNDVILCQPCQAMTFRQR